MLLLPLLRPPMLAVSWMAMRDPYMNLLCYFISSNYSLSFLSFVFRLCYLFGLQMCAVYLVGNLLVLSMLLYSLNLCISKVTSFRMLFAMQFWDQACLYVMMCPIYLRGGRMSGFERLLHRIIGIYFGLLVLRGYCGPFARLSDAVYAFLRKAVLWMTRFVMSPLKVIGLLVACAVCGGPKACYRGLCVLLLLTAAVARHPIVMSEQIVGIAIEYARSRF